MINSLDFRTGYSNIVDDALWPMYNMIVKYSYIQKLKITDKKLASISLRIEKFANF